MASWIVHKCNTFETSSMSGVFGAGCLLATVHSLFSSRLLSLMVITWWMVLISTKVTTKRGIYNGFNPYLGHCTGFSDRGPIGKWRLMGIVPSSGRVCVGIQGFVSQGHAAISRTRSNLDALGLSCERFLNTTCLGAINESLVYVP